MRAYERSSFDQEDVRGTDSLIVLLEKYVYNYMHYNFKGEIKYTGTKE